MLLLLALPIGCSCCGCGRCWCSNGASVFVVAAIATTSCCYAVWPHILLLWLQLVLMLLLLRPVRGIADIVDVAQ